MLLFLMVQLVGLQCVIVVFPDHTHLLFFTILINRNTEIAKFEALFAEVRRVLQRPYLTNSLRFIKLADIYTVSIPQT